MLTLNRITLRYFWLLFFIPIFSVSQSIPLKQQLKDSIEKTANVEKKVQLYVDLAWEYTMEENDSALIYSDKALEFSKKNDYQLGKAIAKETSGLFYEIVEGDYEKASVFYFEGISICEENNLDYDRSIYHSLGVMFHTSDNYEKALEYYRISYDKALEAEDLELQKKCLINLGTINSSIGNYDKAETLLLKSLDIKVREELNYDTYANLGNLFIRQEEYEKSLPYLELATVQNSDNYGADGNLTYLINAKIALKDTTGMQPILERAKTFIEDYKSLRYKSIMIMSLSNYHRMIGDYKTALLYRDEYLKAYETIKEKQRDQTVYDLETKYQTEKTQEALEKKEAEQKLYLILLALGIITASAFGILFYKNRKKKIKLAQQKNLLEATIDEKNVLLKEIHHRVKNSFQIVSSLLYLQSENVEDKEAQLAIKEAENRVRSMVLIHQKLYSKDDLVGINAKEYIEDLTKDIIESYQFKKEPINYCLNLEPKVLDIETITPLGLILNELITNVIKHAFTEITDSSIMTIAFKQEKDELVLEVIDNGIGMPNEVKESSFGLKLITALSKKLKAHLDFIANSQGTTAQLRMKRFEIMS